jgi:hypothetical protein
LKRLAALERTAARQSGPTLWGYITSVLPVPFLIAAGAMFLSFQAWEYYNKGQQEAAKTKIERAEAALAALEGTAVNLKIGDLPAQTAKLKADLERARADVINKQAEADKTRAAADAAMTQSGLYTLEERAARAKLIVSEMGAAAARMNAQGTVGWNDKSGLVEGMLQGLCVGNRYAEQIDCPPRLIAESDPAVATQHLAEEKRACEAYYRKYCEGILRCYGPTGSTLPGRAPSCEVDFHPPDCARVSTIPKFMIGTACPAFLRSLGAPPKR